MTDHHLSLLLSERSGAVSATADTGMWDIACSSIVWCVELYHIRLVFCGCAYHNYRLYYVHVTTQNHSEKVVKYVE